MSVLYIPLPAVLLLFSFWAIETQRVDIGARPHVVSARNPDREGGGGEHEHKKGGRNPLDGPRA